MYERLTKITQDKEHTCVSCINYGTARCHIHNNTPDCIHCEVFAAILYQLRAFEDVMLDVDENLLDEEVRDTENQK